MNDVKIETEVQSTCADEKIPRQTA